MSRVAVVGLLLVALAGCGRDEPSGGSIKQDSKRTKAHVVVKVRGAETIDFDATATIIIYRNLDERVPLNVRHFSVGIPPPHVPFADDASFRTAFDVLGYKGDGSYTIPVTVIGSAVPGPSGLPLPSGIQSNAFVEVFRVALNPPVDRYDIALEPCRVVAKRASLEGSVSCPKLKQDSGPATISLEMTWKA